MGERKREREKDGRETERQEYVRERIQMIEREREGEKDRTRDKSGREGDRNW